MSQAPRSRVEHFPLTDEHRMLLTIRDTLYEGSWDDFERDLRARERGRPHVFETVPDSPSMTATIRSHLAMIAAMRTWEERSGRVLAADDPLGLSPARDPSSVEDAGS